MERCKVCGAIMENFEGYDSEYFMETHYEMLKAYCPHCDKWYRWVEVFKFSGVEDFEEDT